MTRDELRNPKCKLCSLHRKAQFVCLMGSGPETADIVIVGEAPGEREDAEHRAFVGRSGQLLDLSLESLAGINRLDCYVTNVVKCRPPDNRTPDKTEAKICASHYLFPEIEMVHPKWMLLLGNTAMQAVMGRSGITKHHGTIERHRLNGDDVQVMPTLHPAAVLRNPALADTFRADIERFGKLVRGESASPQTKTLIVRNKDALMQLKSVLRKARVIAWDIETYTFADGRKAYTRSNFQEWHGEDSCIVSISFTVQEGLSIVVPLWHKSNLWKDPGKVLEYLKPVLTDPQKVYVAHNGKFDARWMLAKGVKVPQVFDTMLAAHMLEENRPKGLKDLSRTLLGADPYDVGEDLQDAYGMNLRRLCEYNGKDTDYTYRLYKRTSRDLLEDERLNNIFFKLMMPASNALTEIEREGVWIDPERWELVHDEALDVTSKLIEYIEQFVPEEYRPFNPRSSQQMGRLLFEHLKLPVLEKTKTGRPSTKESVLLRLQHKHKVALAIMKYRKWRKYLDTYLWPWKFKHADEHGRAHSNYKLFGTVTGRLSGEGGIQQVPREPKIRSIIGETDGWLFVSADYSQIELRIAAMVANERNMLSQYLRGEDIHMLRAMKMTGKPAERVLKEERKKAKAVNFGYIYGMGPPKFVEYCFTNYDLEITLEEAEADRDAFFNDYPGLRPWHERQRKLARRYHRVLSPIGRIRHLPDILSSDEKVRGEAERQAINSPIQSCASDFMLFSLIRLHKMLDRSQARILGTVHDSILFRIREETIDQWCRVIKSTMEDMQPVEETFGLQVTVPIVADIEVGTHWAEGKPWHPNEK